MFKFRERIEKLMGRELKAHDLSFIHAGGPISELEMLKSLAEIETGTLNVLGVEHAVKAVVHIRGDYWVGVVSTDVGTGIGEVVGPTLRSLRWTRRVIPYS
jgi:hypothetical protein